MEFKHNDEREEREVEDDDCNEKDMTMYETVQDTMAQDDGGDTENMYETVSNEVYEMSTCSAYGTLK